MQTTAKIYKFIGKVLPDGHLSIPDEVSKDAGREFEVTLSPVDDIKNLILLYLEGRLEKSGRFEDITLNSSEIEQAIKDTFGTTDVDTVMDIIRR
ncbi:MAG: hypothetical protein A2Y97_04305 [Nitrospirae bacterium RBG_13_39_12]|nr:MAG: hypothetical protein A2Y97_04305 [Nitrospirae bacterium RBG_13_39_12]